MFCAFAVVDENVLKIVKEVEIKKEKDEEKGGAVVKRKNKKEAEIDELEHIGHTEEVDPVWDSSRIKTQAFYHFNIFEKTKATKNSSVQKNSRIFQAKT